MCLGTLCRHSELGLQMTWPTLTSCSSTTCDTFISLPGCGDFPDAVGNGRFSLGRKDFGGKFLDTWGGHGLGQTGGGGVLLGESSRGTLRFLVFFIHCSFRDFGPSDPLILLSSFFFSWITSKVGPFPRGVVLPAYTTTTTGQHLLASLHHFPGWSPGIVQIGLCLSWRLSYDRSLPWRTYYIDLLFVNNLWYCHISWLRRLSWGCWQLKIFSWEKGLWWQVPGHVGRPRAWSDWWWRHSSWAFWLLRQKWSNSSSQICWPIGPFQRGVVLPAFSIVVLPAFSMMFILDLLFIKELLPVLDPDPGVKRLFTKNLSINN